MQSAEDDKKVAPPAASPGDDDVPPGFADKVADADAELASTLATAVKVSGDEADEPDLSLRLAEKLQDRPEAAITTQTDQGTIYSSASKFEDLNLSPELLKGESRGKGGVSWGLARKAGGRAVMIPNRALLGHPHRPGV